MGTRIQKLLRERWSRELRTFEEIHKHRGILLAPERNIVPYIVTRHFQVHVTSTDMINYTLVRVFTIVRYVEKQ